MQGLIEALQVTPPRDSSVHTSTAYPSAAAQKLLTSAHASQSIWAAAVLGGAVMFEAHTDALIQVTAHMGEQSVPWLLRLSMRTSIVMSVLLRTSLSGN